jgi:hypothetical protein
MPLSPNVFRWSFGLRPLVERSAGVQQQNGQDARAVYTLDTG